MQDTLFLVIGFMIRVRQHCRSDGFDFEQLNGFSQRVEGGCGAKLRNHRLDSHAIISFACDMLLRSSDISVF